MVSRASEHFLCLSLCDQSIRHELLAAKVLYSSDLWKFFDVYVHLPNFEVGSDAFATFKDLLTRHKTLSAQFYTSHFDQVRAVVHVVWCVWITYLTRPCVCACVCRSSPSTTACSCRRTT